MTTQEPGFSAGQSMSLMDDLVALTDPVAIPDPVALTEAADIVDCGDPGYGIHASRVDNSTLVGSEITYYCWKEYELQSGNTSLTCGQDGQWLGSAPICKLSHGSWVPALAAISVMVVLVLGIVISDFIYHKRKKGKYREYWQRRRLGKGQERPTAFIVRGFKLSTVYTPTPPLYPAYQNHYSAPDLCKPGSNPGGSDELEAETSNDNETLPRKKKGGMLKKRIRRNSLDVLDGTYKQKKKTKKGRVQPIGQTDEDPGSMSDTGHYSEFPPMKEMHLTGKGSMGRDEEDNDTFSSSQRSYRKEKPRDLDGTMSSLEDSHRFSDMDSSYSKTNKRKTKKTHRDMYEHIPQEEETYYKDKKKKRQPDIEMGEVNESFEEEPSDVLPPKKSARESKYVVERDQNLSPKHRPDVFVVTRYDSSPGPLQHPQLEMYKTQSPEHSLIGRGLDYSDSYENITNM